MRLISKSKSPIKKDLMGDFLLKLNKTDWLIISTPDFVDPVKQGLN